MPINYTTRFLKAILFALLLGCLLGVWQSRARAEDCDSDDPNSTCFYVYYAGLCSHMEPYSYWWYFWNCGQMQTEGMTAEASQPTRETVTYRFQPDGRVFVDILREYPGGQRSQVIREVKGPQ